LVLILLRSGTTCTTNPLRAETQHYRLTTMLFKRHLSSTTEILKQKPRAGILNNMYMNESQKSLSISLIVIFGITLNLVSSIVLYITFLLAYTNNRTAIININNYNEANLELVLIPIFIILGIIGLGFSIKNMDTKRDRKI